MTNYKRILVVHDREDGCCPVEDIDTPCGDWGKFFEPKAAVEYIRADIAKAEALLLILADDKLLEAIARGYDQVDAKDRGEKYPWGDYLKELEELDPEIALGWKQGRIECAKEGIYLALEVVEEEE